VFLPTVKFYGARLTVLPQFLEKFRKIGKFSNLLFFHQPAQHFVQGVNAVGGKVDQAFEEVPVFESFDGRIGLAVTQAEADESPPLVDEVSPVELNQLAPRLLSVFTDRKN